MLGQRPRDVAARLPRRVRVLAPLAAVVLLAVARPCRGQDTATTTSGLVPVYGLHVGAPQRASVMLGVGRWRERADAIRIAFVAVEPGLGAGRASVGYFRGAGNLLGGIAVRASALRTWRDPWSVAPNRTYVGLEASGHAILNARVGLFHRTSPAGGPLLVTWDLGLLF